jgi:hypothetical protein
MFAKRGIRLLVAVGASVFLAAGDQAATSSTVAEIDSTAPSISAPDLISIAADGVDGATVEYETTATDDEDGGIAPGCTPASGALFPLGDTTVTCTATDTAGNTAEVSIGVTVTVPTGARGFQILIDAVDDFPLGDVATIALTLPLEQAVISLRTAQHVTPRLSAVYFRPLLCRRLHTYQRRFDVFTDPGGIPPGTATVYATYKNALATTIDCG